MKEEGLDTIVLDKLSLPYKDEPTLTSWNTVLDKIKNFGFKYVTYSGSTFGYSDAIIPKEKDDIINGGKKSMQLARWLEEIRPFAFNYIAGSPNGLILESGLVDRWVMATFEDAEVMDSAKTFEVKKQLAKGLHFLLVQHQASKYIALKISLVFLG